MGGTLRSVPAQPPIRRHGRAPGPTSGRGRTQAERRATSEQKLLEATARVVARRGNTGVSFADIAREAGCSHGLPGYLFGSKTELLLALVEDSLVRFRDELAAPAAGGEQGMAALLGMQRAYLDSLLRPLPYTRALYVMMSETAALPPELQAAIRQHQSLARRLAGDTMREGIALGHIRPDIDPDAQAVLWFGALRGIGQQVLLDPDAIDVPAVTQASIDAMIRSLAVDGWTEGWADGGADHVAAGSTGVTAGSTGSTRSTGPTGSNGGH
jgi:AcrR family transcriptional regulator